MKTNYIVGHYIQYNQSKHFHVDFTHNDLKSAMESWQHLCKELPKETDVEIHKQTTEVIVSRKTIDEDEGSNRCSTFNCKRE